MVSVVEAGVIQLAGPTDRRGLKVELDDGVALELVEINRAVVDHLTSARPRVRESMGGKVILAHEVCQRSVFTYKAIVVVAIHVIDLTAQRQHESY